MLTRIGASVRQWPVWRERPAVLAFMACVGLGVVVLAVAAALKADITPDDLLRLGVLAGLSLAYAEVSRQVEHRRKLFATGDSATVNITSTWCVAAILVLPTALALIIPIAAYAQLWLRSWRYVEGRRFYRSAFSGAVAVLCCGAAALVLHTIAPAAAALRVDARTALGVAAALVAYRLVNTVLISGIVLASTGKLAAALKLGSRSEHLLDISTYGLGFVTAAAIVHEVWLSVLVLPAVFLLQHQALIRQLVDAATKDSKTDLLNSTTWRRVAERELARAERQHLPAAVLMVDLDHFKAINDRHGHLAGDAALRAVSFALADELRDYDAVGRFGGEEFVALLPGVDATGAVHAADRIRRRVAQLRLSAGGQRGSFGVTASVGAAVLGEHGADLPELLQAADDAVYAAKGAGRDTCRLARADSGAPLARTA